MAAARVCKETVQMNEQSTVQEESLALMRKRILGQDDPVGAAMAVTRDQAEDRLKAERVQGRLKRLQGWNLVEEGKAITRVRKFEDPLVASAYLAFASLQARQAKQPLRVSANQGTLVLALTGRSKGPEKGITDEVLDLAEQLG
jgi:pterin-4a-carbinolamine dehydratase